MRTPIFVVLLMFAGAALLGTSAFACEGCRPCASKKAIAEKKVAEDKGAVKVAAEKKVEGKESNCEGCGSGCGGCGSKANVEKKAAEEKKVVEAKKEEPKAESGEVYVVSISDMCCAGCGKTVRFRLMKVDGVAKVEVDTDKGTVTVTMKAGKTLDKAACETALKGTDYGVTSCEKLAKAEDCGCGKDCGDKGCGKDCGCKSKKAEAKADSKAEGKGCEGCGSKKKVSN